MRVKRAVLFLSGSHAVGLAASMTSAVVTFRYLEKADRGDLSLVQSSASLLGVLLTLGLVSSGAYLIAGQRRPKAFLATWTAHGLAMTAVLLVAVSPLAFQGSTRYLFGEFPGWTLLLPLSLVSGSMFFNLFRGLVVGLEKYDRLAYVESGLSGAQALGLVVIWWLGILDKYVVVGWLLVVTLGRVALLVGALAASEDAGAEGRGIRVDVGIWQGGLRVGSIAFSLTLLGLALFRSNLYLVNYFYSSRAAATYGLAMMIADLLLAIPGIVGQVVMTRTAGSARDTHSHEAWALTVCRLSRMCVSGSIVALGIYYSAGRFLIPLIFGEQYREAVPILDVLMVGTAPMGVNFIYSNYFSGLGYRIWMLAAVGAALLVSVLSSVFLIPWLGSLGGAIGSSLGYLTMFAWYLRAFVITTRCQMSDVLAVRARDWRSLVRATG